MEKKFELTDNYVINAFGIKLFQYATLHKRVEALHGRPKYCEVCGTTDPTKRYEWANVTGDYFDIRNGYKRMCVSCHRHFDHSDKGVKNNVER